MNSFRIHFFKLLLLSLTSYLMSSCQEQIAIEEPTGPIDYSYKAAVFSPLENETYYSGDTLPLKIEFISETNEYVHNIQVIIASLNTPDKEIYNVQSHVHVPSSYEYFDKLVLKDEFIQEYGSEWLCISAMWDHTANAAITKDTIKFKISG